MSLPYRHHRQGPRPRSVDVGVDATCHVECRRENGFGRGGVSEVRAEHEDRACNEIIAKVIEALDWKDR